MNHILWIAALLAMPSPALGQVTSSSDRFRIPENVSRCEKLATTENVTNGVGFRFDLEEQEPADDRVVDVEFDSLGVPKALFVLQSEAIAVMFQPDGNARMLSLAAGATIDSSHVRNGPDSIANKTPQQLLEPADVVRAKALAQWLWKHRCLMRGKTANLR